MTVTVCSVRFSTEVPGAISREKLTTPTLGSPFNWRIAANPTGAASGCGCEGRTYGVVIVSSGPCRVQPSNWIVVGIHKDIRAIDQAQWIATRPPPQPRGVIPRPVISEAVFLVPLLARVAITLQAHLGGAASGLIG